MGAHRASVMFVAALMVAASGFAFAQEGREEAFQREARVVIRQNVAFKYYLEKGDPGSATKYLHSMYLYLQQLDYRFGKPFADEVFRAATHVQNRKEYFQFLGVSDADGNLYQSDGPCTYFWQSARDGRRCGERAVHPSERFR